MRNQLIVKAMFSFFLLLPFMNQGAAAQQLCNDDEIMRTKGTSIGIVLDPSAEQGDPHWSVIGHKLVSDRIYELLRTNDAQALKLGFQK